MKRAASHGLGEGVAVVRTTGLIHIDSSAQQLRMRQGHVSDLDGVRQGVAAATNPERSGRLDRMVHRANGRRSLQG